MEHSNVPLDQPARCHLAVEMIPVVGKLLCICRLSFIKASGEVVFWGDLTDDVSLPVN